MATSVRENGGRAARGAVLVTGARIQIALASVLPDRAFDALTRRLLGA
jgi:hypothetical protein